MPQAIWKGSISFGLVNIPVAIVPAENRREELAFRMLDRRNLAPVRNERVNEKTGEEVPWEEVVKGYEYDDDQYVVLSDEDFRRANVEATQTINIQDFVDADQIDPLYLDKPYYLTPSEGGGKAYALLRETLRRSGKAGVATVVIRKREHLAAILARGPVLVLELLRYAYELRDPKELELPGERLSALGIRKNELDLAERLVDEMTGPWKPEKYHDEFRDDLLNVIEKKVKEGRTTVIEEEPEDSEEESKPAEVVDIMELLQKSLHKGNLHPAGRARTGTSKTRKAPSHRRKAAHKKKA